MSGEVASHRVHRVRQIFPGAGHSGHHCLPAEFSIGSDFSRHTRYFRCERAQLIHHRIDGLFELQNLAANVDRNLAGQVTARHSRGDFSDVTNLTGKVAGHQVHIVGEVFPSTGNVGNLRLSAEFAFRSHFAGDARHLGGEHAELLNHCVDKVGRTQKLAFQRTAIHVQANSLSQVALGHGCDGAGDFCCWASVLTETSISPQAPLDS